jgi:hypothetical protein
MPLQNRVTPFGELLADPARGLFMGNRGDRIHDGERRLLARRWASKQWICCALAFRGRHRTVWGAGYTELFFLDEVTALSAGHRPCFECRRADAIRFAQAWERASGLRPRAAEMDAILHAERLDGRDKRTHLRKNADLPDGAMIVSEGAAYAVRGEALLRWSPERYATPVPRPRNVEAVVLTPPAIVAILGAGYGPRWHDSAERT